MSTPPTYDPSSLAGRPFAQVGLRTRDLARARRFYGETLGLHFLFEASNMLFFQAGGGVRLMVGLVEPQGAVGGSILYFDAPDIDRAGAALEAKGVKFSGEAVVVQRTETHELKLREFFDPDGNALALMGAVAR
jgi:predicted enzyme related to lactoylglutathione lyase